MTWGLIRKTSDSDSGLDFLRRGVDALFDDFFSLRRASLFENEWIPSIDVQDRDGFITIKADMPGLSEKNIEVTLDKNVLIISGEKKDETNQDGKDQRYFVSERRFGSFRRAISLPDNIIQDQIEAEFKNGVLNIEIPKDENAKTHKIEVKAK